MLCCETMQLPRVNQDPLAAMHFVQNSVVIQSV